MFCNSSMVICAALCSQNNQCSAYQWSQNNGSCQLGSPFGLISSSSQGSIVIYLDMDFDESNQGNICLPFWGIIINLFVVCVKNVWFVNL